MKLVAGIDSSTQSCKVVIRDANTGTLVRSGKAAHPDGTEVHPDYWWSALQEAIAAAGGLADVAAISVGGQQHGMVCLDEHGEVVRPALLWNDTRSAQAAEDLIAEVGVSANRSGSQEWAEVMGVVPVASFTITKLRWLAQHEPELAKKVAAVCLPHDWLSWKLSGSTDISTLRTDRSDASGTGYWSAVDGQYHLDYLTRAFGRELIVPTVLSPSSVLGQTPDGISIAVGAGDNAAAAFGLQAKTNEVIMSVGTSGVVTAVAQQPSIDPTGVIAGFADASGQYLPLLCTLNGARVFDATAKLLKVSHDELSSLALAAPSGAQGLSLVPYFEGERTPNLPDASASLHGLTLSNFTSENIARAAFEGVLGSLAVGLDELAKQGVQTSAVSLIGGAAAAPALRALAPVVLGVDVTVPASDEYVANGAARQAAWIALESAEAPQWDYLTAQTFEGAYDENVRMRYNEVASLYL